jgi:hypothetical protein
MMNDLASRWKQIQATMQSSSVASFHAISGLITETLERLDDLEADNTELTKRADELEDRLKIAVRMTKAGMADNE